MRVRTVLADHSELALLGLRTVLAEVPRVDLVGVARDPIELQALLVRHRPEVVLIDHTAEGFGAQTIRDGLRRSKTTRFVSITPDPSPVALMSAIRAGVTSYIKKDCDLGEIVDAVQQARGTYAGAIVNLGGYTHTSVAIRDAFLAAPIPFVEVHISNLFKREAVRHHSMVGDLAIGVIAGFGARFRSPERRDRRRERARHGAHSGWRAHRTHARHRQAAHAAGRHRRGARRRRGRHRGRSTRR